MHGLPSEGSMHDDELMERLLRDAMTADTPHLSPGFDARVLRRVRPRRLTSIGRAVIAAAAAFGAPMAAAAGIYGRASRWAAAAG